MGPEDQHTEYKVILNDALEKETVAFLNAREGGRIYIGVADDGSVTGVESADKLQLTAIDRIRNNIEPPVLGLFEVITETIDDRTILRIEISSGPEKPYYLRSKGMTPNGCFLRVGTSCQPMTFEVIRRMSAKRARISLRNVASPRQDLTFAQLRIFYEEAGLGLPENFARNLDLLAEDGKYNYYAYLLADSNRATIRIAKYLGRDKTVLVENKEFGYCSLIKATYNVLGRLDIENVPATRITGSTRAEEYPVDVIPLREAVINAIVHNDYARETFPVFEIYSDRLTITSSGGLPTDLTSDEFLKGYTAPRNRELMRIFKDVRLVEHIGSGVPRIIKRYGPSVFSFSENFLRVIFPYPAAIVERNESQMGGTGDQATRAGDKTEGTGDKEGRTGDKTGTAGDKTEGTGGYDTEAPSASTREHRESLILGFVTKNGEITNEKVRILLGLKESQSREILRSMVENGKLIAVGDRKSRSYRAPPDAGNA